MWRLEWCLSLLRMMRLLQSSTLPTGVFACLYVLTLGDRRWLAHAISDYYGLDSKSVTVGNPGRRVVYLSPKASRHSSMRQPQFPRPMWEVC